MTKPAKGKSSVMAVSAASNTPLTTRLRRSLRRYPSLFFMPGLRELIRRHQALAELSADESAVNAGEENRSALAEAMLSFSGESESGEVVGSILREWITFSANRRVGAFRRCCASLACP